MERTSSIGRGPWIIAIALIIVGPLLLIEAVLDFPDSMMQVIGTVVISLLLAWTIYSLRAAQMNRTKVLDQTSRSAGN